MSDLENRFTYRQYSEMYELNEMTHGMTKVSVAYVSPSLWRC